MTTEAKEPTYYAIPPDARAGLCKSCGARILWRPLFNDDGTPKLNKDGKPAAMPLSVNSFRFNQAGKYDEAINHFVDCPSRDQHRREK